MNTELRSPTLPGTRVQTHTPFWAACGDKAKAPRQAAFPVGSPGCVGGVAAAKFVIPQGRTPCALRRRGQTQHSAPCRSTSLLAGPRTTTPPRAEAFPPLCSVRRAAATGGTPAAARGRRALPRPFNPPKTYTRLSARRRLAPQPSTIAPASRGTPRASRHREQICPLVLVGDMAAGSRR